VSNIPEGPGSNTDADLDAARKYHSLMELGRGGTAVVSAGIARGPGGFTKLVVLKNIKEECLGDRETVRMFVNEARLSARLNHPNVVQVYEVFRQNRLPVIVMEYLDGQSLAKIQARAVNDPAYTAAMAITILCRVLAGLEYAHTLTDYDGTPLELVHRDVSPHNVMLTYDGQVKLVDFGIAKLNATSEHSKTGVVKGKIAYMAPEQLEGGAVDHRSDLFSAGVMLWEMIARRRMWGKRSDAEILRSLATDDVPKLRAVVPGVHPELAHICNKALAFDPDARYTSAAHFQAELERYLEQRSLLVRQQEIADVVTRICADLRDNSAQLLRAKLAEVTATSPSWQDALGAFEEAHVPAPMRAASRRVWLFALSAIVAVAAALLFDGFAGRVASWFAGAPEVPATPPSEEPPLEAPPSQASPPSQARPSEAHPTETPPPEAPHPSAAAASEAPLPPEKSRPDTLAPAQPRASSRREPESSPPGAAAPSEALHRRKRLAPLRHPAATAERTPAPPATTPAPEAPSENPPAPACDPPYYIGSDGLKHYRRECL
jgi:eukaryotic-like serine/threonine-protein kinase